MASSPVIDPSRHAHVQGALALVKLRGIDQFMEVPELHALMGLTMNATLCSLSTGQPVPVEIHEIREHVSHYVDTSYPKWTLSYIMLQVADLAADMRKGNMTLEEKIASCTEIDNQLARLALRAGSHWPYERKFVSGHDSRTIVPDGVFPVYDIYPSRMITQMWNVLRTTRILLCEEIGDSCARMQNDQGEEEAKHTIVDMIREICASVPQMTNCDYAARHKLPSGSQGSQHTHTMSHVLDVYIMIFNLYIVAWSRYCPTAALDWTVKQLHHIADHFAIKEAAVVLDILDKQRSEARQHSWYV